MAKNLTKKVTIWINGKQVENNIASIQKEMTKVRNELRKMTIGTTEYEAKVKELRKLNGVLSEHRNELKGVGQDWRSLLHTMGDIGNIMSGVRSFGYVVAGMANSVVQTTNEMAKMDDAMGMVRKTTMMTQAQVEQLNEMFKRMDTRTSREQLNELAYEAGKLGIRGVQDVYKFVEASDMINVALGDVLGDKAMITIGKLTEVYTEVTKELGNGDLASRMYKIGNAINQLGKDSTANEQYIVDFAARLAGVATQAGLSADKVMGFASALSQDMQRVEMSATAFQKLIVQMFRKPEQFAALAGKSVKEFSELVRTDMNEALMLVLGNMKSNNGLEALVPILDDVKLSGQRATTVIADMANNLDKVRVAQETANYQIAEGSSMLVEYGVMNDTAEAKMEKARKKVLDMRVELGQQLMPVAVSLLNAGSKGLGVLSATARGIRNNWAVLIPLTSALVAYVAAKTKAAVATSIDNAARNKAERIALRQEAAEWRAIAATSAGTTATEAHTLAVEAERKAMMKLPWGWIVAGVTAVIAVIGRLTQKSRENREEMKTANRYASEELAVAAQKRAAFDKLTEGSSAYKAALEDLRNTYPGIMDKYIAENNVLRDKEAAWDDVTAAIIRNAKARAKEERMQREMQEIMNEEEKFRNRMNRRMGRAANYNSNAGSAQSDMNALLGDVETGRMTAPEAIVAMSNVMRRYGLRENVHAGLAGDAFSNAARQAEKMYKYTQKTAKEIAEIKVDFGATDDTQTPTTTYVPTGKGEGKTNPWEGIIESVTRYVEKANAKVKEGLAETLAEVENGYDQLVRKIEGEDVSKLDGGQAKKDSLLNDVKEAFLTMKRAKIDEYIDKMAGKVDLWGDKMDELEQTDPNKYVEKVKRAQTELAQNLATLDGLIEEMQGAVAAASGADADEISRLEAEIQRLVEIKQRMVALGIKPTLDDMRNFGGKHVRGRKKGSGSVNALRDERDRELASAREDYDQKVQDVSDRRLGFVAAEDAEWVKKCDEEIERLNEDLEETEKSIKKAFDGKILEDIADKMQDYGDEVLSIWSSINTIMSNIEQKELNAEKDRRDEALESLEERYEKGLITQEVYEQKKAVIEEDYDKKQQALELKQWRREKAYNIAVATMDGVVAIMKTFAKWGWPEGAAMMVLQGAATATQIAALASSPAPYAKGGYANEPTILVGERGPEWVASNRLLSDRSAAPMIAALDAYQKGDRKALASVGMAQPRWGEVSRAAGRMGRDTGEMMEELLGMLKRGGVSAVISRQHMLDFEKQEQFLRNRARI